MVTTRQHPGTDEFEQLGEKGKQASKQEGPIAKKPKTAPLQEAEKELEEGQEQMYSKEKEQLVGEVGQVEEEQNKRAAAIEEEGEEGGARGGGGRGKGRGGGAKGGKTAEPAEEEEEEEEPEVPEEEEEEEEPEAEEGGEEVAAEPAKGKGAAKGKAAQAPSGGGKKSALGLQVGEPAPEFALKNEEGENVALKDFKGRHVALYFFNKAGAPVVTKGGAAFAKVFPEFEKLGIPLLFIGPDSVQANKKFKEKAGLPFMLLSDPKKEVARMYHNLKGRNVARTTVMIDPEGKVLKVWADIPEGQVEANPKEALQFTQQLLLEQEA